VIVSAAITNPLQLPGAVEIPRGKQSASLSLGRHTVYLTNLQKPLWPRLGLTRRDVLQYYADIASVLFPHVCDRPIAVRSRRKSRPGRDAFPIERSPGKVVEYPVIQGLASMLGILNQGSIELRPWSATCDDVHRPDSLSFAVEPPPGGDFDQVRETALAVRRTLDELEIPSYPKTNGVNGIHICVPITRGPRQEQVWKFVRSLVVAMRTDQLKFRGGAKNGAVIHYSQNSWGKTLPAVYSLRPTPQATVSTPLTWNEVERGVSIDSFRIDTVPQRVRALGDLWKPMLQKHGRLSLERLIA
jgi:bifunctional non-homologous end joining protein LigD